MFDSIDGAVRCAVKVQQQVPAHDADQPHDCAIRFRIGIEIGDAIPDGWHGEAVNVAARLQAECPPGEICISRSVRDHAHDRLGLRFDEVGAISLKNIARPVEAFLVRSDTGSPARKSEAVVRTDLPLPDKPSIAVLLFTNFSSDPEQEYFADGMVEDVITALARIGWLFVIARNSSFAYKGRAVDHCASVLLVRNGPRTPASGSRICSAEDWRQRPPFCMWRSRRTQHIRWQIGFSPPATPILAGSMTRDEWSRSCGPSRP